MFIDRARIRVVAGDGGNGCMAFRREKFVPRGGPSGGDGGRGGDVYLECSDRVNTLLHFQYQRVFKAGRGGHGEGSRCHGRDGEDAVVLVPPGTQVYREPEHELVHDFAAPGERIRIATGGKGGRGNARFATSTNRAPRRCEPGRSGEEVELSLSLKLIADVGSGGLPQCRQVDPDLPYQLGASQDRGLPVHNAGPAPWSRGGGGFPDLCSCRYPRADRGGARGARPRGPVPEACRDEQKCWFTSSTCPSPGTPWRTSRRSCVN